MPPKLIVDLKNETLVENPNNHKPPVREMWAVISRDGKTGNEALVAARVDALGMVPLVARDKFQLEVFVLPKAKLMWASMRLTGKSLHLLHFINPVEVKFPWE